MKTAHERAEEAVARFQAKLREGTPSYTVDFPVTLKLAIQESIIDYADDFMRKHYADSAIDDVNSV